MNRAVAENKTRIGAFSKEYLNIKAQIKETEGVESQLKAIIEEKDKQINYLNRHITLIEQQK